MIVLGAGGSGKDAAWAVARDGEIVAAIEEHKIRNARSEVLRLAGAAPGEVDVVSIARPAPGQFVEQIRREFPEARVRLVSHHTAHAASAFFASGADEATVLTMDSGGDLTTTTLWQARGAMLTPVREMQVPDSVASLYSRVTRLLGFEARADEHKVQWLAAAAESAPHAELFEELLGEPWSPLSAEYLAAERSSLFSTRFYQALELASDAPVAEHRRSGLAASLQAAVERYVIRLAGEGDTLCLAGGLFFNVLLVRALESSGRWKRVYVQPAAGNSGTALGAAYLGSAQTKALRSLALGPSYTPEEIKRVIENCKLRFRYLLTEDDVVAAAEIALREHKILGWMQGRVEFGPRALGHRSILASPLDAYATENLNTFIKQREGFRKFAAAVPAETASQFFDVGENARFLATVGKVRPAYREAFSAALFGKDLIRVHLVEESTNPLFHRLLRHLGEQTGLPVVYNTSFNLFGDPLAATPRDAVRSFFSSGVDVLLAGSFLLEK